VVREPSPPKRPRSPSPAELRRRRLAAPIGIGSRTYTVEAICAIPHPTPTHALASSACITHLLTGSDDGYVRDYDVFSAVNGKTFLTAPQRHHTGVVEGLMKAGQLRSWWENPPAAPTKVEDDEPVTSPVYSLACHSDALWALAGSDVRIHELSTISYLWLLKHDAC
jgi:transcriptional activator SPT8